MSKNREYNLKPSRTNVFYANDVASRSAVNSPAKLSDLKGIIRTLRRNRQPGFLQALVFTELISKSESEVD